MSALAPHRSHYRILYPIIVSDIYPGTSVLPARLAWLSSHAAGSFLNLVADVEARGGEVAVSDMFRTTAMQTELRKRKPALASPPGKSCHEAGLAVDVDIDKLGIGVADFHALAAFHGWHTVRGEPWHLQFVEPQDGTVKDAGLPFPDLATAIAAAQAAHTALIRQIGA